MERRPIVREAEPLYRALAKASLWARKDPGWSYIRVRIDHVTRLFEDLVKAGYAIGCKSHEHLTDSIREVEEALESGEAAAMRAVISLEERIKPVAAKVGVASAYARTARIIASLLLIISGASLTAAAETTLLLVLGALTIAMGIAAGLLSGTHYSDLILVAGLLPIALYTLLTVPPTTALIAGLGVGLAAPLPATLRRLIAGGPGWAC